MTKFRNDLVEWYDNLVAAYTLKTATPTCILLVVHSAGIIERLGSISNAQGLEQLNDKTTKYFDQRY